MACFGLWQICGKNADLSCHKTANLIFTYPFVYPLVTLNGMTKDSGLRIRVQRELREKFLEVCRAQDKPAAQVIREFMRTYINQHDMQNASPHSNESQRRQGLTHEH